jgi:hypothetical protein
MTPKNLEFMFGQLSGCCLHQPAWTPVDAQAVLCSVWSSYGGSWQDSKPVAEEWDNWKGSTDAVSYTVALLKDGRYGLLSESEDYTGHGCQCSAAAGVYGSLDELLRLGVDDDDARDAIRARLVSSR